MPRKMQVTAMLFTMLAPGPAMTADANLSQLIADLEALRVEHGVPGFALTLMSGEQEPQTFVGGVVDLETERPITPDTLFRIGSITKTFNALAVLQLVEQGRIDLNAPLRDIVPDPPLENPWTETHPVRVAHLLEHSSGLLDISREEFDHNQPFATLEAAFAFRPHARRVQWQPGLHAVYSNANAGLVGLVIERVSGQDYQRYMRDRLLRPLGMNAASLYHDDSTRERLATGYDTDGKTTIPYWHMIFPPLGAINATPKEMGALLALFLRHGKVGDRQLLSAASIERMERPETTLAAHHGLTYGYGLGLDQSLRQGFLWYGHGGDGDGYLSHFGYNRQAQVGYFVTINAFKHDALRAMKTRVQDELMRGQTAPQAPVTPIGPETLAALTGTYVAVTRRFQWQGPATLDDDRLQLVLEDGALYTRSTNGRRQLIPAGAGLFRREGEPLATIAIAEQDGDLYLQADFGNYRRAATDGYRTDH